MNEGVSKVETLSFFIYTSLIVNKLVHKYKV